jgi:hypothetical protein
LCLATHMREASCRVTCYEPAPGLRSGGGFGLPESSQAKSILSVIAPRAKLKGKGPVLSEVLGASGLLSSMQHCIMENKYKYLHFLLMSFYVDSSVYK